MKQFSAFAAIAYTPFSRDLYRDAYLRWQGLGISYLLLLNMLIITPVVFAIMLMIERSVFDENDELQPVLAAMIEEVAIQLPELRFEDGQMDTDVQQPHVIHVSVDGEQVPLVLIDLNGELDTLMKSEAALLLTRDAVHAKMGPGKVETRFWSEMDAEEPLLINAQLAQQFAQEGAVWLSENKDWLMLLFGALSWAGTVLVMVLYRAAQALLFAMAALGVAHYFRFELRYSEAVRLTCLAITPPILIDVVLGVLVGDTISLPLFMLISFGYIVFAVRSNAQMSEAA